MSDTLFEVDDNERVVRSMAFAMAEVQLDTYRMARKSGMSEEQAFIGACSPAIRGALKRLVRAEEMYEEAKGNADYIGYCMALVRQAGGCVVVPRDVIDPIMQPGPKSVALDINSTEDGIEFDLQPLPEGMSREETRDYLRRRREGPEDDE